MTHRCFSKQDLAGRMCDQRAIDDFIAHHTILSKSKQVTVRASYFKRSALTSTKWLLVVNPLSFDMNALCKNYKKKGSWRISRCSKCPIHIKAGRSCIWLPLFQASLTCFEVWMDAIDHRVRQQAFRKWQKVEREIVKFLESLESFILA